MSIIIREADLVQDQDVLINTRNQNRDRERTMGEGRYRWRYLENPHGQAKAWLAIDDRSGDCAGFTVVHPRLMYVDGQEMVCWNCGDFSINKRYRTLGVAIKLRSAATQCVSQGEVPFLYAHPNDRMEIVHRKVGHSIIGRMVRYVRILRVDRYLPDFMKHSWFSTGLARTYNSTFMRWKRMSSSVRSFSCESSDVFPAGASFDALQEQVRGKLKVFGQRSCEYLKWRFGTNPLRRTSALLIYRSGELVGYAFSSYEDEAMYVHDLFCLPEPDVSDALIAHLTAVGCEQNAQRISVTVFESNPLIRTLQSYNYRLRPDTSSFVVHTAPNIPQGVILRDKTNWFMTVGDRDV